MEYSFDSQHSDMTIVARDDAHKLDADNQPLTLTEVELKDLTCEITFQKSLLCC